jgi:large subunit ribosomal protein L17
MRHRKLSKKLSRPTAHRRALLSNLVKSLFEHERITTTLPKAKVASGVAERMITLAKVKNLASQKRAVSFLGHPGIVKKLFKEIGPRFLDRQGGYTRVIRLGRRPGDRAFMAILELVNKAEIPISKEPVKETKGKKKAEVAKAS